MNARNHSEFAPGSPLAGSGATQIVAASDSGSILAGPGRRGGRTSTTWPKRDVCQRGHPRTPENLIDRDCRICKRERKQRYRAEGRHGYTPRPTIPIAELPQDQIARLTARFWAKVEKTDRCWLWTGTTNEKSYGFLTTDKKRLRATHMSWFLRHGVLPDAGVFACHTCDNPRCVNPDHLFLGSAAINNFDRMMKGRSA